MGKASDRVRGRFMTSTCGDTKRLTSCEDVQINGRRNITLTISGREDDLYLEVNSALAQDIIDFLHQGLKELKESQ